MPWISTSFPCDRRRALRRLPVVAVLFLRAFVATFLRFVLATVFFFTAFFFATFLLDFFFATFFLLVFLATFFVALTFFRTGFFLVAVFRRAARFGAAFFFAVLLRPDFAARLRVPVDFLDAFFLAAMLSALRD